MPHIMVIKLKENGEIEFQSTVQSKIVMYGMLETVKEILSKPPEEKKLVEVPKIHSISGAMH